MFKLNRKLEYSLIALKHMHRKRLGELSTAKEITSLYKTPFDATSRVLQIMTGSGILKSEQGAHGGYQILKDLSKISFLELAELILGEVNMVDCLHENNNPDENNQACGCELHTSCNIISPIFWLNERTKEFYRNLMIRELIETDPVKNKIAQADAQFAV